MVVFGMSEKGLLVHGQIRIKPPCLLLVHAHKVNITMGPNELNGLPYRMYLAKGDRLALTSSGPHDLVSAIVFPLTKVE